MIPLHPKIIHFPIALLITALLFAILAIAFKKKRQLFKDLLFWNIILGTLGAITAVITGLIAQDKLVHNEAIHELLKTHETLGFIIASVFIILSVWLLIRRSKMDMKEFVLFTFWLAVVSGTLVYSADIGGKMVYELGAGVIPMEETIQSQNINNSDDSSGNVHQHGNNMNNHENMNENMNENTNEDTNDNHHENMNMNNTDTSMHNHDNNIDCN